MLYKHALSKTQAWDWSIAHGHIPVSLLLWRCLSQTWCQKWPPWRWHSPERKSDQEVPSSFHHKDPNSPWHDFRYTQHWTLRICTVFTDSDLSWWSLHGNCFWHFLEQKPPDSTQAALSYPTNGENLSPMKRIHRVRRRLTPQASRSIQDYKKHKEKRNKKTWHQRNTVLSQGTDCNEMRI